MNDASEKWPLLFVTSLANFVLPLMSYGINIALPSLGRELNIDPYWLGWVAATFTLSSSICVIPAGRLGDIYGRKKVFLIGVLGCAATSFLLSLSNTVSMIIAFRALQGVASAMVINTSIAIVSSVFPAGQRGRALGINLAAVFMGQSFSPLFGGWMTHFLGWRSLFYITIPLWLVVFGTLALKIKSEWAEAKGQRIDIVGSVIYGLAVTGLIVGFSKVTTVRGLVYMAAGAVFSVAFYKWELRADQPIIDLKLFRENKAFSFAVVSALINYSSIFAVSFLLSLYLQYIKGYSPEEAGYLLVAQPVVQAVLSPMIGRLADRFSSIALSAVGMALTACGLFAYIFLGEHTGNPYIVFCLLLVGAGMSFFVTPNTHAVMSSVERKHYGLASGTQATMRQVGQMVSMTTSMLMFSVFLQGAQVTPEHFVAFLKSIRLTFMIFFVLCVIGVFTCLVGRKASMPAKREL